MLVSYDGGAYSGWQLQSQEPSIQAEIEAALSMVLREGRRTLSVCATGRTDSGVHAEGQVRAGGRCWTQALAGWFVGCCHCTWGARLNPEPSVRAALAPATPTQVVQFFTNVSTIDPQRLPFKLNSLLPDDIRVREMHPTAPDFVVTVSAIDKVGGSVCVLVTPDLGMQRVLLWWGCRWLAHHLPVSGLRLC